MTKKYVVIDKLYGLCSSMNMPAYNALMGLRAFVVVSRRQFPVPMIVASLLHFMRVCVYAIPRYPIPDTRRELKA